MQIQILGPGDEAVLARVADDVFDHVIDPAAAAAYVGDPRLHLAVAIDAGIVVGFASGVHYHHPDKPIAELFVNEVGVAPTHRGRNLGRDIVRALLDRGRELGCDQAWVLTDRGNAPAMRTYAAAGGREVPPDAVLFQFDL